MVVFNLMVEADKSLKRVYKKLIKQGVIPEDKITFEQFSDLSFFAKKTPSSVRWR